jgi:hypothetical protein
MANIIVEAFNSLAAGINKAKGDRDTDNTEGIVSDKFPELKLNMPNEELLKLTIAWEKKWIDSNIYQEWLKKGDENEKYWKGEQFDTPVSGKIRPLVDNVIFESLETYLPQVTRRNPDPMVTPAKGQDDNEETQAFTKDLQKELGEIASEIRLRLKLKKAARHWAIYLLGVGKVGWDLDRDIPTIKIIRGKKLILDPTAVTDEDGYSGEYIGEYRKMQAGKLIATLKDLDAEEGAVEAITSKVNSDLGTEIQYKEWWTDQYLCWTLGDKVLFKTKNPHWNYDKEEAVPGEQPLNPDGTPAEPQMQTIAGINHFYSPKKPFILLSVFNLGKAPMDDVSLIGQNLPGQDLINKRNKQIDKNADSMNGGMVVSLERSGMSLSQASGVTEALRKGGTIAIPTGSVNEAIQRMSAPELPITIYNQLQDSRNRVRDIFGTSGFIPASLQKEKTVRGKYQIQGLDTDRIGGGFSEYLEQFADDVYNWFVQLLFVYDERYVGKPLPRVRVDVKEGSLLPKDSTTIANQAIDLASANKMSLLDMYKRLDYPNPEEMAANAWLEINAPEMLYSNDQRIAQVMSQRSAAAGKPPSASINYKDLPPEGQAQLAAQAGIQLHAEAIAAHDEFNKEKEQEATKQAAAEAAANKPARPETGQ